MTAKDRLEKLKQEREARKGMAANQSTLPASNVATSFLPEVNGRASGEQLNGSFQSTSSTPAKLKGFQKSQAPPKFVKDPTPLIPAPSDARQRDLWAVMAQQTQYDYESKLLQERKEHAAKMKEQQQFLDQQVALRAQRKAKEREEHLSERPVVDQAHQQWIEENQRKKQQRAQLVKEIGEDRSAQIEQRNNRKHEEAEHIKAADRAILANIAVMQAQAKARQQEEARKKVEMKEDLIAANEDLKQRLEAIKLQERALEREVVEGMRLREIRDHEKRVREAELFNEKVKGREAMAMKLQATMEQRSAEDEARANAVTEERAAKQLKERREAYLKKEREKEAILAIRAQQVEAHKIQREAEKEAKIRERAELNGHFTRELLKLEEEHIRNRAKLVSQKDLLDAQMDERQHFHPVLVSSEEQKLNSQLLQKANRDKAHHTALPYTAPNRDSGYKNRESSSRIY